MQCLMPSQPGFVEHSLHRADVFGMRGHSDAKLQVLRQLSGAMYDNNWLHTLNGSPGAERRRHLGMPHLKHLPRLAKLLVPHSLQFQSPTSTAQLVRKAGNFSVEKLLTTQLHEHADTVKHQAGSQQKLSNASCCDSAPPRTVSAHNKCGTILTQSSVWIVSAYASNCCAP